MIILRSIRALQKWRRGQNSQNETIGFVPTMGALHPGHVSLIQRARRSCRTVVVSIFVNPLQFGPTEDLQQYPQSLTADLALCRQANVDVVFLPPQSNFYPRDFQTSVAVSQLTKQWEGERRPTHFQGVTTAVTKFLNVVRPDRAFFGQKDYQQYLVVKQLVKDLHLDVTIGLCPTIREPDGLAWSSRNQYLTPRQRQKAPALYRALCVGKQAILEGKRAPEGIRRNMQRKIEENRGVQVEYLAVGHAETLEAMQVMKGKIVLLGAIRLGHVRLIDNLLVRVP